MVGLITLVGLSACSTSLLQTTLKPAFDIVYVDYVPAELATLQADSTSDNLKCKPLRPESESMLSRPFRQKILQPVLLHTRTDTDCQSTVKAKLGSYLIVVARQQEWLFVQLPAENKEGWISADFIKHGFNHNRRRTNDCIDLEWSHSGMRVKNICDRDISDMWICLAKKNRKACSTNWHQIGRLDAGKTDVLRNMPRHTSSWWFWRICFEPGKVTPDRRGYYCS